MRTKPFGRHPLAPTAMLALTLWPTFLCSTLAEVPVQAWLQRYNGPGNGLDHCSAVVVDRGNNVIVAGDSEGAGSYSDYAIIKYSPAGVPLWTNRYNGPNNTLDFVSALGVDAAGNLFVTGWSIGINSAYDFATLKYSSAGIPLWTNRYDDPGHGFDEPAGLVVDAENNVIVTGQSANTNGFPYNYDYLTIKYSNAGVPLWTNRYNGPGNSDDYPQAVAVDGSNNVLVTGRSASVGQAPYTDDDYDFVTIKYSSAGLPLWTNRFVGRGGGSDYAGAIAVDRSNNVIVTGWSAVTNISSHRGDFEQYCDVATVKYSGAGVPLWTNYYNGPGNGADEGRAVAVDGNGDVIMAGLSTGVGTDSDYLTIKYSSTGIPLWTNTYNGIGNWQDVVVALAVDSHSNVIVSGFSHAAPSYWTADFVTIKYSGAGIPLWTKVYSGPANEDDRPYAMALDAQDNVIVAGGTDSPSPDDFVVVKYLVSSAPSIALQPATSECGTTTEIAAQVSDPNGDAMRVVWTVNGISVQTNFVPATPAGTITAVTLSAVFPLGTNYLAVEVTDGANTTSSAATVTVVDTTPPVITAVGASPKVLWPPNHQMVSVEVLASASDSCGQATWKIIGVRSNEPPGGRGGGNTSPDWRITGEHTVLLRAERSGGGEGRIYYVTVQASDDSGNKSQTQTVRVRVPTSQAKPKL